MTNLHVTYDEMRSAASRLSAGKEDIDARLLELRSFIDQLVSSGFVTTAASGAFQEQFVQFTTGASQTIGSLEGLGSFLRSAADALQQADESLAASIRGR